MRKLSAALAMVLALSAPAAGQGFFPQAYAPTQTAEYAPLAEWFRDSGYLQEIAQDLNRYIDIPTPVQLAAGECGQVNAFFRPDVNPPTVVMCYEMVETIQYEFEQDNLTDEQFADAQRGALDFVLFHEIGHALVHVLGLPITGREEDVADQFATVVLTRDNPMATLWAARFFKEVGDPGHAGQKHANLNPSAFADEHALDEQRFYNILCWTYGASPDDRAALLAYIPRERAARCPAEYQQLENAWRTLLSGHARLDADEPEQEEPVVAAPADGSLAGQWRYSEHIEQPATGVVCDDAGTLVLQAGAGSFVQTGKCTVNGRQMDNPANGTLASVRVDRGTMHFLMGTCEYNGALVRTVPARVEGLVTCLNTVNGQNVEARGTWAAER